MEDSFGMKRVLGGTPAEEGARKLVKDALPRQL
jgi:hypothetical protein